MLATATKAPSSLYGEILSGTHIHIRDTGIGRADEQWRWRCPPRSESLHSHFPVFVSINTATDPCEFIPPPVSCLLPPRALSQGPNRSAV